MKKINIIVAGALTFAALTLLGEMSAFAQLKVGDNPSSINAGSVLEMESADKGLLLPRVSLTSSTVWGLAGVPVAGMQVFNINVDMAAGSSSYPVIEKSGGVYYWDGAGWVASKQTPPSGGSGDYDWLKTSNNANPSNPADISTAIYHGGAGDQEVTVRSSTVAANRFARLNVAANQGSAQLANISLFAENNTIVDPEVSAEFNALTGIQTTSFHPLVFRTTYYGDASPVEKMRINPGGGVGIGTTGFFSDSRSLSVRGPISQFNGEHRFLSSQILELADGGIKITSSEDLSHNGFLEFSDEFQNGYDTKIFYSKKIGTAGALVFRVNGANENDAITVLKNNGHVGINKSNPGYKLDVQGDINASGEVRNSGVILTSDNRLKRNIQPVQNGLRVISKLNPVSYEKKATIQDTDYNKSEIGFIAQEVQKILPELVREGKDSDKTLALDYISLIPILTKAIQEQQKEIEKLITERNEQAAQLKTQAGKLENQSTRLDEQAGELAQIKKLLTAGAQPEGRNISK